MPARNESRPPDHPGQLGGGSLPGDLVRPEAYSPPPAGAVRLASTHASWVFLTETEAWKVKRPVNYGFLDYSDAEKRRRCCLEELRLGARLAPDVYLGVEPIYLAGKVHSFVGPGSIVDHAVRMRRLADDDSALRLLAGGRLSPEHLDRLATRLADFYAASPATPELGMPAHLASHIAENHRQLQPYVERFVDRESVDRLHRWQQGQLVAQEARLDERLAFGRIRDGHGDLRLEHVYFAGGAPGRPLVIDPIEFNRRFRCADVALDVAFLAMELDAAGRPDLAAFFLSCFARASNDYHFYPLLDLYLCYRAQVRCKVACFVAGDPATPPDKARRKRDDAARLLALALCYQNPAARVGQVIAVGGLIASGKSSLAAELSRKLLLPVVSSDFTRKHLGGLDPDARGGPELYTDENTRRTYREMCRRGQDVLASGRGVILDGTFRDPEARQEARRLAESSGRPFLFVELYAGADILRERLRRREKAPGVSDARESLLAPMLRDHRPATELPRSEYLRLDGSVPLATLAARVARALDPGEPGP